MTWAIVAGSVISAGASIYAGNKAAGAQTSANDRAIGEQQRQYNIGLNLLEPQRMLGYQAGADLAQLYGYATPGYQSANNLLGGIGGAGGGLSGIGMGPPKQEWYEKGVGGVLSLPGLADVFGFGGRRDPQVSVRNGMVYFDGRRDGGTLYGGHINPVTGEVWVDKPGTTNRDPALSEQATAALRSGKSLEGGPWGRFNLAYNQLAGAGWKYNPDQTPEGVAASGLGPRPAGEPGDMSRFFASPDYNFRKDESMDAIKNLASVRGGIGGNVLREGANVASGLAAGEFNNYVSRLMQLAGFGASATGQAVQAGQSTANNISGLYSDSGNARASGYMTQAAGVNNAVQGGLQNWMFNRYLQGGGGSGYTLPADISGFQYPFDTVRG